MERAYRLFIDGEEREARGGGTFTVENPADRTSVFEVADGTAVAGDCRLLACLRLAVGGRNGGNPKNCAMPDYPAVVRSRPGWFRPRGNGEVGQNCSITTVYAA
jgi:hypothetical protein